MTDIINKLDRCWWCGNNADTAEHIYKKTDLEREFGKKQEFIRNQPVRFRNKELPQISIESSKSKSVKFPKSLCANCNNIRSQPHDYAYDKFVDYFKRNENVIYDSQIIDLQDIYGDKWEKEFLNVIRYFAKNFCCRLEEHNIEIINDIKLFLDEKDSLKTLSIRFYLRKDIFDFLKIADTGSLHLGSISYQKSQNSDQIIVVETTISYRSLTVGYFYSKEVDSPYWKYLPNSKLYLPIWDEMIGYK